MSIPDHFRFTLTKRQVNDLPPLNVATFRERISGVADQGSATDVTREEVHCGESRI
jgi:hypothetical protein